MSVNAVIHIATIAFTVDKELNAAGGRASSVWRCEARVKGTDCKT